ncbi:PRTRC system protein E [Mucilaginibacter terrae]|uniref:PRTRC genetic system protein E n=1 Tax=Mucilaginibacter terrae TaxID=1955052 RepID=A0ABU3GNB1_9SPHI|nr:PRTRC system protein E [Mucilaginibacter terrae]MDT3401232.1 PRTRC genetic system protein E [Mucilaginibacter terrae]
MTTDFFKHLTQIAAPGIWKFTMQSDDNILFTVSALFSTAHGGDAAAQLIPPMLLKGTAEELDAGFFKAITAPVQQTSALFANMEQYQKQQEAAQAASKEERDKKQKAKAEANAQKNSSSKSTDIELPDKAEKKKAYDTAMKTIGELISAMKYEEALAILPAVSDYPEKETELKNKQADLLRMKELKAQHSLNL